MSALKDFEQTQDPNCNKLTMKKVSLNHTVNLKPFLYHALLLALGCLTIVGLMNCGGHVGVGGLLIDGG